MPTQCKTEQPTRTTHLNTTWKSPLISVYVEKHVFKVFLHLVHTCYVLWEEAFYIKNQAGSENWTPIWSASCMHSFNLGPEELQEMGSEAVTLESWSSW